MSSHRSSKMVNLDCMIDRLLKAETPATREVFPLKEEEIESLCHLFKSALIAQPVLLELEPPLVICGDIHGQYKDLLSIFDKVGPPTTRNYLFLGDYVDRGQKSLECYCLLMALKLKHPLNLFLLRGNHQSSDLNKIYGFYDECKRKFSVRLFKSVTDTFLYLPVAAVVANRVFCVHGGLSPLLKTLEQLNRIKRPVATSENRLICDLLWSDPNPKSDGWDANFERGVSYIYGKKIIDDFLTDHDLDFICRSHQVVEQGYEFFHGRKLITIFSAPNYCGQFQNFGGVLQINSQMVCSVTQIKGPLQKYNKVIRPATPIKGRPNTNQTETDHRSESCSSKENRPRYRKATQAVTPQKLPMPLPTEQETVRPSLSDAIASQANTF